MNLDIAIKLMPTQIEMQSFNRAKLNEIVQMTVDTDMTGHGFDVYIVGALSPMIELMLTKDSTENDILDFILRIEQLVRAVKGVLK